MINPDLGLRASARSQTTRIARSAIKAGLKTIVFANTRLMVEVLTKYLKDVFDSDPRKPPRIRCLSRRLSADGAARYRNAAARGGSSTASSRRTRWSWAWISAASMCACSMAFPGTIAAHGSGFGRAGRRNRPAMGVLVATSDPLDQYIIRHPEFFTAASPEHGCIDPDQLLILMDHIRCAAFELPFLRRRTLRQASRWPRCSAISSSRACCITKGERWHWIADSYPANSVSLRSVADGNFVVVDVTGGKQDDHCRSRLFQRGIDAVRRRDLHDPGQPWQVEKLDWEGRKAFVTRTHADYYTDAIDYTKLKILDCFEEEHQRGRRRKRSGRPVQPRRGASGAPRCRLQEDTLLHATRTSATAR